MQSLEWNIVPDPLGEKPYKVVFTHGGEVLAEWHVDSEEDAERRISSALNALGRKSPPPSEA